MRRGVFFVVALALSAGSVYADSPAIAERRAILKKFGEAAGAMVKMTKGELPFDLAKVQDGLKTIVDGTAKLPSLFPDDSKTGDTKALPELWDHKSDVSDRYAKLGSDAKAALAAIKDLDTLKTELPKVGGNCGGCHKLYRQPQT